MKTHPPFLYLLLSLLLLTSCSRTATVKLKEQNKDFYYQANRAKSQMTPKDYKAWLVRQIQNKKAALAGLEGVKDREGQMLGNHEAMTEGATSVSGHGSDHDFKADRSRQRLKELEEEKKLIRRHLFYLNSQLSDLDTKLKI